jgi:hypothetical protein
MTVAPNAAEWLDAKASFRTFTLTRTVLDRLAREKRIRSCSLASPGLARNGKPNKGKRLYNAADIRAFLEARATGGIEAAVPS